MSWLENRIEIRLVYQEVCWRFLCQGCDCMKIDVSKAMTIKLSSFSSIAFASTAGNLLHHEIAAATGRHNKVGLQPQRFKARMRAC